jgi:hypothetical protein
LANDKIDTKSEEIVLFFDIKRVEKAKQNKDTLFGINQSQQVT